MYGIIAAEGIFFCVIKANSANAVVTKSYKHRTLHIQTAFF